MRPCAHTHIPECSFLQISSSWFVILLLLLLQGSKWMSSGAAMGSGIYMANQLSVSLGYAGGRGGSCGGHWPNAERVGGQNPVIVAICEVIDR